MLSRLTMVVSLALVLTLLFSATAYAADDGILNSAVKVNNCIDREIEKAVGLADKAFNVYKANVDTINQLFLEGLISQEDATDQINACKARFDFQISLIVRTLVIQTESQANALVRAAYNNDIIIVKEYIEVNIAGSIYMIDPLRIVGH